MHKHKQINFNANFKFSRKIVVITLFKIIFIVFSKCFYWILMAPCSLEHSLCLELHPLFHWHCNKIDSLPHLGRSSGLMKEQKSPWRANQRKGSGVEVFALVKNKPIETFKDTNQQHLGTEARHKSVSKIDFSASNKEVY